MTIEQYLFLRNVLDLKMLIALQRYGMLTDGTNVDGRYLGRSEIYNRSIAQREIEWITESIALLEECYKKGLPFGATAKKIQKEKVGIGLLPAE